MPLIEESRALARSATDHTYELVVIKELSAHFDEAEIVRGLRKGDPRAWDALCDQFGKRVWGFLVRLVGTHESDVSDLFQETFLAAAKSGRNLDEQGTKLWNWLSRIAHNLAADHWRRVYRDRRFVKPTTSSDTEFDDSNVAVSELEDPVALLTRHETVEAVRGVLAELTSAHAAVLIAKYVDGQSVATIVAECGGTTEGVRSRLARARREFKSRFERSQINKLLDD